MKKIKITLRNGKEIIVSGVLKSALAVSMEDVVYRTDQVQFLNFLDGPMVCIQDISAIEEIEDDNSN